MIFKQDTNVASCVTVFVLVCCTFGILVMPTQATNKIRLSCVRCYSPGRSLCLVAKSTECPDCVRSFSMGGHKCLFR